MDILNNPLFLVLLGLVSFILGGFIYKLKSVKTPPPNRVDSDGVEIPVNVADSKGYTQGGVDTIKDNLNPFKDTVKVNGVDVVTPVGIKPNDISTIVEVNVGVTTKALEPSDLSTDNLLKNLPVPKDL